MPELSTNSKSFPLYVRRIKCPAHYVCIPGKEPFLLELNPMFKFLSDADAKRFNIRKYRAKKDKYGRKMQNFKNYYQPTVTAGFALEHIYDPRNPLCSNCKRCHEGAGFINERTLKRISS